MESPRVICGDTSAIRLHVMTLKFETFMMDRKHTMIELVKVMSVMIPD